jgi:hypothetical protein
MPSLQPTGYFAALTAAQRFFCAAAIFRRAAALTWRFLLVLFPWCREA